MVTVSAIIPVTDDPDTLSRWVAALERGRQAADEMIVVREPASANAATACNLGAGRASGDLLLALVEDVDPGMRPTAWGETIVLDPSIQETHLKLDHPQHGAFGFLGTRHAVDGSAPGSKQLVVGAEPELASALVSVLTVVACARRSLVNCLACAATLVTLNPSFYAMLVRRRGVGEASAGAAVPAGVLRHLREQRARGRTRS